MPGCDTHPAWRRARAGLVSSSPHIRIVSVSGGVPSNCQKAAKRFIQTILKGY